MSALKSLPEVETAGWYVRTRRTDEDDDGSIVSNSGVELADHYAYAHTYGNAIAALTCEAINVARETGIGPAELRRQRDELRDAVEAAIDEFAIGTFNAARRARVVEFLRAAIAKTEGKS